MIQSLEGMDLTDRIREMSGRIAKRLNSINTEEATKTALVLPSWRFTGCRGASRVIRRDCVGRASGAIPCRSPRRSTVRGGGGEPVKSTARRVGCGG